MPQWHKDRAILDGQEDLPEFLQDILDQYRWISLQRGVGFGAAQPILETLQAYDRMMRIDREPYESEILITLDTIERAYWAKLQDKRGKEK